MGVAEQKHYERQVHLHANPSLLVPYICGTVGMYSEVREGVMEYAIKDANGDNMQAVPVPDCLFAVDVYLGDGLPAGYYAQLETWGVSAVWTMFIPAEVKTNGNVDKVYGRARGQLTKFGKNILAGKDTMINPYDMPFGFVVNGTPEKPTITYVGLCFSDLRACLGDVKLDIADQLNIRYITKVGHISSESVAFWDIEEPLVLHI